MWTHNQTDAEKHMALLYDQLAVHFVCGQLEKIHGRYVDQFQMSDDINSLMQNHFLLGGVGNLNAVGKSRVIMFSR